MWEIYSLGRRRLGFPIPRIESETVWSFEIDPIRVDGQKDRRKQEEEVEKRAEWELMGISMETFRRRKEGKKDARTRFRPFWKKKKKKTIAASQNHCSGAISRPARSGLDRVKKQFSFRRDRTAGDHGYSIAYLGFDKAIPIQSSFERTDDRARGKRAARLGRRSTGSAPERAKNWTRCERFQAERTSVDPISKRRVKEIATVSLAQLCWFRAHYCALLYSWAEMGKISISLTGKLVIWDQF